jgi:hypothetical protein
VKSRGGVGLGMTGSAMVEELGRLCELLCDLVVGPAYLGGGSRWGEDRGVLSGMLCGSLGAVCLAGGIGE